MQNAQTGIVYLKTGNRDRGRVKEYHQKPHPLELNKTPYRQDIAGLKSVDNRNFLPVQGEIVSRFTIGMEVEKNTFSRGAVREYELFCGFERDRSCGYEAVTHILPLLPSGVWRNKVFDMMYKAGRIIEDQYSSSDDRCGGHISVGVLGMTGSDIMEKMRGNCGILMAIFHKRIKNSYCYGNPRMMDIRTLMNSNYPRASKYNFALPKDNCLEFRIPSRFQSVKQMIRRYELMYQLVSFSINTPNGSHAMLMKKIKPILMSMYEGNEQKVNERIKMAEDFRRYILTGYVSDLIKPYLSTEQQGVRNW
jgi:hypothetical protein